MVPIRTAKEEDARVEVVWIDSTEDAPREWAFKGVSGATWAPTEPRPTAWKEHLFIPTPRNQVKGTKSHGWGRPHALLLMESGLLILRGIHFSLGKVHFWLK